MKTRPLALVVAFDRLPLRFLGCCGNRWIETPHFDRLAATAVVFDLHFAENLDPDATRHAWWSGRYEFLRAGSRPAVPQSQGWWRRLLAPVLSLFGAKRPGASPEWVRALRDRDIEVVVLAEPPLERATVPTDARCVSAAGAAGASGESHHSSFDLLVDAGLAELQRELPEANAGRLLWSSSRGVTAEPASTQTLDGSPARSHALRGNESDEFDDPESEWSDLQAGVAAEVARLDGALGRLLDEVSRLPVESQPLLIVTAAAGMSAGERDGIPAGCGRLAEEHVHTPLLVRLPGSTAGARRQELVQTVDLAPTLLEWFCGGPNTTTTGPAKPGFWQKPDFCEGRSLMPLVRGERSAWREHVFLGDGEATAVRSEDFYLVRAARDAQPGESESRDIRLFVKPDDLWEINNVAEQSPDDVERLRSALETFPARLSAGR